MIEVGFNVSMVAMSTATTASPQSAATLAEARDVAAKFASEIRTEFGSRVRCVRLYGSTARGDWTTESDIDVLILLDQVSDEDSERIVDHAVALGVLGSGLLIQPVFMAEAEFTQLRNRERLFALEVERDGVDL